MSQVQAGASARIAQDGVCREIARCTLRVCLCSDAEERRYVRGEACKPCPLRLLLRLLRKTEETRTAGQYVNARDGMGRRPRTAGVGVASPFAVRLTDAIGVAVSTVVDDVALSVGDASPFDLGSCR